MAVVTVLVFLLAFHVVAARWGAVLLAAAVSFEGIEHGLLRWCRRKPARTGAEGMLGRPVTALSYCAPEGWVRYGPEYWSARCPGGATPGEELVIERVEGLTLVVSRAER